MSNAAGTRKPFLSVSQSLPANTDIFLVALCQKMFGGEKPEICLRSLATQWCTMYDLIKSIFFYRVF